MRKFFRIFLNWRIDIIALLFTVGIALLVCDGDDIKLLFVSKAIGLLLIYLCGFLTQHWDGKIKELKIFEENDDDQHEAGR